MRTAIAALLLAFTGLSAGGAPPEPPSEWIDAATGHRVVRLSVEPGSRSLYFHQNPYTAEGDKLVISTPGGLAAVTLATRKVELVVEGRVRQVVVGKKSRQVFYMKDGTVYATHLDTRATRAIVTNPRLGTGSGFAVNADETLLAGSMRDQTTDGSPPPSRPEALPGTPAQEVSLEARWLARRPMTLYTIDIATGQLTTYTLEPNVTLTPDGRGVAFSANIHGTPHVYLVDVARAATARER